MRFTFVVLFWAMATSAQAAPSGRADRGAHIAPADMLERLDHFRDSLSASDRSRLDKALPRSSDGGIARCDRAGGSRASCEVAAYLPALRALGLTHRFHATRAVKNS